MSVILELTDLYLNVLATILVAEFFVLAMAGLIIVGMWLYLMGRGMYQEIKRGY